MKTTLKFMLITMIATLGFYNLKASKTTNYDSTLTHVENSASSDSEDDGKGYKTMTTSTGTTSETIMHDGEPCTRTCKFDSVTCEGSGTLSCTTSYDVHDCEGCRF